MYKARIINIGNHTEEVLPFIKELKTECLAPVGLGRRHLSYAIYKTVEDAWLSRIERDCWLGAWATILKSS